MYIPKISINLAASTTPTGKSSPSQPGEIAVPNPALGRQGLENFLDRFFIDNRNTDADIIIDTPAGEVEVRISRIRSDRLPANYIILSTSSTAADSSRLYITLNNKNQPISLNAKSNSKDLFAGLLDHAGCPYLANLLGVPDRATFAEQVDILRDYDQALNLTREIRQGSLPAVDFPRYEGEKGVYVDQKCFASAPLSTPLSTHRLVTCSALIVIDRTNSRHYLAHIDDFTTRSDIEGSLQGLDLQNSDLYIMRGDQAFGTLQNILVILVAAGLSENVTIVGGNPFNDGVTTVNGEVYLGHPAE